MIHVRVADVKRVASSYVKTENKIKIYEFLSQDSLLNTEIPQRRRNKKKSICAANGDYAIAESAGRKLFS